MSGTTQASSFYIGWDVGAWHCKRSGDSCDAIVILDSTLKLVGEPWRDNLREAINIAPTTTDWVRQLFSLCEAEYPGDKAMITLSIDTPLGFSDAFVRLVKEGIWAERLDDFRSNPYLFRHTEKYLSEKGLKPLSAVQDQLGSQATKGMHVIAKFAPNKEGCGVWTDGVSLTAIESYPAACKASDTIARLRRGYADLGHGDIEDALTCALVAYLFASAPDSLASPFPNIPRSEGWIWVPKDGLRN